MLFKGMINVSPTTTMLSLRKRKPLEQFLVSYKKKSDSTAEMTTGKRANRMQLKTTVAKLKGIFELSPSPCYIRFRCAVIANA